MYFSSFLFVEIVRKYLFCVLVYDEFYLFFSFEGFRRRGEYRVRKFF